MSPTERGLWDAVLANADDDLARLVYADYLEENGRAPLAHFIRAQITLSQCPPGHPQYADAVEAQSLAVAAARGASSLPAPSLPDGATFAGSIREIEGDNYGSYERGFASRVTFSGLRMRTGPGDLARALTAGGARDGDPRTTHVTRAVAGTHRHTEGLRGTLTGLGVTPWVSESAGEPRLLADADELRGIKRFALGVDLSLARVGFAVIQPREWAALEYAPWLGNLTHLSLAFAGMLGAFRPALGPQLTAMEIGAITNTAHGPMEALAMGGLDALTSLSLPGACFDWNSARSLARLPLRNIASLRVHSARLGAGVLAELLTAPYFDGLAELTITGYQAAAVSSLTGSGRICPHLRILNLDEAVSDGHSLAELARPGLLFSLSTLSAKRQGAPKRRQRARPLRRSLARRAPAHAHPRRLARPGRGAAKARRQPRVRLAAPAQTRALRRLRRRRRRARTQPVFAKFSRTRREL